MHRDAKILVAVTIASTLILAILVAEQWVGILLLLELVLIGWLAELLGMNLPKRLAKQVGLNSLRADGSLSERRRRIEVGATRNLKINIFCCLALGIIPLNVAFIAHNFFLPQLERFQATVVLEEEQEWLGIFLRPEVQLVLIIGFMTMFAYSTAKRVYLRLLKDFDDELAHRAEHYAIHDLMTPRKSKLSDAHPVDNRQTA